MNNNGHDTRRHAEIKAALEKVYDVEELTERDLQFASYEMYVYLDNARVSDLNEFSIDDLKGLKLLTGFVTGGEKRGFFNITPELGLFFIRLQVELALRSGEVDGYVYLLRTHGNLWKIGRSKNPANRLKTFKVTLPYRIKYEMVIPSQDYKTLEKWLHETFADRRIDGEWFELTDGEVQDIRAMFPNVAENYR